MPFEKGKSGNAKGRPKGVANKSTTRVRNAIASFADQSVNRFIGWIDEVAEDDPKAAAELFLKTIEYHIPKLQRTELSGLDGEEIKHEHKLEVKFIDGDNNTK